MRTGRVVRRCQVQVNGVDKWSAWVLWVEEKGERSSRFHLRQLDELGRQQAELDP